MSDPREQHQEKGQEEELDLKTEKISDLEVPEREGEDIHGGTIYQDRSRDCNLKT